jgi:hypothetical protein
MKKPVLLRRRYIPYELVDISGDEMLFRSEELLVTKWISIRPRSDFFGGISFIFLDKGYKVNRFYDVDGNFTYWYCDIIDVEYDQASDTYTINDLLVDIVIHPDGRVKVLDADELAQALDEGLVTVEQTVKALKTFDGLIKSIYDGSFPPEICSKWEY